MNATDDLQDLWAAVFGGPPFIRAEPRVLIEVLVDALPPAPPYDWSAPKAGSLGKT